MPVIQQALNRILREDDEPIQKTMGDFRNAIKKHSKALSKEDELNPASPGTCKSVRIKLSFLDLL